MAVKTELDNLLELETILTDGIADDYPKVNIYTDIDEEFELLNTNQESTPVVLLELDLTASFKTGSKGQMINGGTDIKIFIIVAKNSREFTVYYEELVGLGAKIRDVFQLYPDKSIQYISSKFVNDYYIANDIPAVAIEMTVRVPVGNFDYSYT